MVRIDPSPPSQSPPVMVVESLAALEGLPLPETVAVLMTVQGALDATSTVTVPV